MEELTRLSQQDPDIRPVDLSKMREHFQVVVGSLSHARVHFAASMQVLHLITNKGNRHPLQTFLRVFERILHSFMQRTNLKKDSFIEFQNEVCCNGDVTIGYMHASGA